MAEARKRLKTSSQATLLRKRNRHYTDLDNIENEIKLKNARAFRRDIKSIARKKLVKTAYNMTTRLLRRRFQESSWICTQNGLDAFFESEYPVLVVFSLHFKLKNGVSLHLDGELERNGHLILYGNRQDLAEPVALVNFFEFVFNNELLSTETPYAKWTQEDLDTTVEHIRHIRHAMLNQLAFFVMEFSDYMNARECEWIAGAFLYEKIAKLFF